METTSVAGHMYYMISDGNTEKGYGFSPIKSGISGPGHVVLNEHENYQNPAYTRTLQITRAQYEKLEQFGQAGRKGETTYFNLQYQGVNNSCVDFTWGALNHAGLHTVQSRSLFNRNPQPQTGFDGTIKVLENKEPLQRIPAPFPDSKLNQETETPLPERNWLQRRFSQQQYPDDFRSPAHPQHAPFTSALAAVQGMERAHGIAGGPHTEQLAAALTLKAAQEGWTLHGQPLNLGRNGQIEIPDAAGVTHRIDSQRALEIPAETYAAAWRELHDPLAPQPGNPALAQLSVADRKLFDRIRELSPLPIDDAQITQAMCLAKQNGIHKADDLGTIVATSSDQIILSGNTPGFRASMQLNNQPPDIQESLNQNQALNQQMAEQETQRQQQQQTHAMKMA
ncbi:MAG: hypothetical protein Q4G62_01070 [Pseudomonadota bacterium]|nr:hypothetical protein [Pseudomonadota bacterium]